MQEFLLELAGEHVRALDQCGDFVQQRVVLQGLQAAARLGRSCLQLAHDFATACGKAGDHRALGLQLVRIAVGVFQHHRRYGCFKTMAQRLAAGLQAQHADRHDVGTMQRHQGARS